MAATIMGLAAANNQPKNKSHFDGFDSWCSDSWAQKRSCAKAAVSIREAAGLIRKAAVLDETTGQYTVDVAAVLAGTGVLATDMDGAVVYDGTSTGFLDIAAEDEEFWRSIRKGGFNYLPGDGVDSEVLSFSHRVPVKPLLTDEDELEEIPEEQLPAPQFVGGRQRGGRGGNGSSKGVQPDTVRYLLSVPVPIIEVSK